MSKTQSPEGGLGDEDQGAHDLLASWNDADGGGSEPSAAPANNQERTDGTIVQNLSRGMEYGGYHVLFSRRRLQFFCAILVPRADF